MNEAVQLQEQEEGGSNLLNHLPAILWQRRWLFLLPFVLFTVGGILAAFLLPTSYRSHATLSVESPELPSEIIGSPVAALIDQRIAKIRQEVLSRGTLIEIIQENDLYERQRQRKPLSAVIDQMRAATVIEPIGANIGGGGGRGTNTIAFTISFLYEDPVKAQRVMQAYVERFVERDATEMAEQADSTVRFLSEQAESLQRQIVALEGQITDIKTRNGRALASAGVMMSSNSGSYDAQIAALRRENNILMSRSRTVTADPALDAAEAQLAALRSIYSDNHPDVRRAQQQLAEVRRTANRNRPNSQGEEAQRQIEANNAQIEALGRARSTEMAQSAAISSAQSRAPVVMEQISQLDERANALRAQYKEAADKLLSARTAAQVEDEQKGERLSITEPPAVPDAPTSPNRLLLVLMAIMAGAVAGFALALLIELVLRPIRDVSEIEQLLGAAPLVVVPTLREPRSFPKLPFRRRKKAA